jgi:hypothetical protein
LKKALPPRLLLKVSILSITECPGSSIPGMA